MSALDEQYKKKLIERYVAGEASEKELQAFFGLLTEAEIDSLIEAHMDQEILRLHEEQGLLNPVKRLKIWKYVAAASVLIFLSTGGYFILHKQQPSQQAALLKPGTFKNDAVPGNKAILTLANGSRITVSNANAGSIAQQGIVNIQKSGNGNLVYQATQGESASTIIAYNTFTTLRGGGKHSLTLADGTLAILDAGSSVTYPVSFSGTGRQVEITGQVYFEVVYNAKMPFSVKVKNQIIKDLGTHFNINAYDDERDIKTTLLEGSITIASDKNKGYTLKPGQQAITSPNGTITVKDNVNSDIVIAWKNDLFKFDSHTSLPAVMRELSRWYDLDVVYEGTKKHYNFGGDIPRNSKLSDVLTILEYSGVQFAIDGKKIIVYQ